MTITEKILANSAGKNQVKSGEIISSKVDLILANDITAPLAISEFEKIGAKDVFDKNRIVFVADHFTPNKDIASAEQCKVVKDFARKYGIKYFEVGEMGIEHAVLPEKGWISPGMVVIGADSHTCTYGALGAFSTGVGSTDLAAAMALGETWFKVPETIQFILNGELNEWVSGKDIILQIIGMIGVDGARYRAMEFTGDAVSNLSMDNRFTISNMAIEAGGKNGIFAVDEITRNYINQVGAKKGEEFYSDDADYIDEIEVNVSDIEPLVAKPHLPSNIAKAKDVNVEIDQVVIGSCTNGRIEDLRIAAKILEGKKVNKNTRTIVIPATQGVYLQAIKEGLIETFIMAEAAVSTPTCGPCLGGHMGILASGERAVATTNRNFLGRMGHPESEVYLASPAVAAASAITGRITDPREIT